VFFKIKDPSRIPPTTVLLFKHYLPPATWKAIRPTGGQLNGPVCNVSVSGLVSADCRFLLAHS